MAAQNRVPLGAQGVLATSPVGNHGSFGQRRGAPPSIPLNLLAIIISYVEDSADLARLTRASRLLYYMTLPKLYEKVVLRSYAETRYINGRPEGYGGGSPFAMGLQGLVVRSVASYVHDWCLAGEMTEKDNEEYTKGRVPDSAMMLNISVRAAMDRMQNLESFSWELNTKPLQPVYLGLASRPSLTSLVLKFPSTRTPRPTVLIPPMPELRSLVAYDMDPLCHPDDISLLLARSLKLEHLKLHWNPRMREAGEEINMMTYFGRCIAAKRRLNLKSVGIFNMYGRSTDEFEDVFNPSLLQETTFINSMGSGDPMTVFLDETWKLKHSHHVPYNMKMMRGDVLDSHHADMLSRFSGMERLYIVSPRRQPLSVKSRSTAETPATPSPTISSPSERSQQACVSLASDYLAVIQTNHGHTLRHLLLSDQWLLSAEALNQLLRRCPNLEQFGVAIDDNSLEFIRSFIKLIPKLYALRILLQPGSELMEKIESLDASLHAHAMAREFWRDEYKNLKWFGLGTLAFECGPNIQTNGKLPNGVHSPMRRISHVPRDAVKHVEIWGLDSFDL